MADEASRKLQLVLDTYTPGKLHDLVQASAMRRKAASQQSGGLSTTASVPRRNAKPPRGQNGDMRAVASRDDARFQPPAPQTEEQLEAQAYAMQLPHSMASPMVMVQDAGYMLDKHSSRWDARSCQAWTGGYRHISAVLGHRIRSNCLEYRVRWLVMPTDDPDLTPSSSPAEPAISPMLLSPMTPATSSLLSSSTVSSIAPAAAISEPLAWVPGCLMCDSWMLRDYRWSHRDTLAADASTVAFSKRVQATGHSITQADGEALARKAWAVAADGRLPATEGDRARAAPAAPAAVRRPPRRLTTGKLGAALAQMPSLHGAAKRGRLGEDEDWSGSSLPNVTNVAYATVTARGRAVVEAALASSTAAGGPPPVAVAASPAETDNAAMARGEPHVHAPHHSDGGNEGDDDVENEDGEQGDGDDDATAGAEYEFAFLVRDMRQPLSDRPVVGCLPVSASELEWTIDNTGCLQVPGYGIEDDDVDDLEDREKVLAARASKRVQRADE